MAKRRIYYEKRTGSIVEVEARPADDYSDENRVHSDRNLATVVVDAAELEGVPLDGLQVKDEKLKRTRRRRGADHDGGSRAAEILAMDKSSLSDARWLELYREYLTITGAF